MKYVIVEKNNHHAIHAVFDDKDRAEKHLKETIPLYVRKSYFDDKTLTANSFEIIEYK